MSIFKTNTRNNITDNRRDKIQRKKDTKYWVVSSSICIVVMVVLVAIFCFTKNSAPKSTINKEGNPKQESTILSEDELITSYISQFFEIYEFLYSKLYNTEESKYLEEMKRFAIETSPNAWNSFEEIVKFKETIDGIMAGNANKSDQMLESNYKVFYLLFDEYAKLIRYAYRLFEEPEYADYCHIEQDDPEKTKNARLVYQQLHIRTILLQMLGIIKSYKTVILDILKQRLKSTEFQELSKVLFKYFKSIKDKMFIENKYTLNFENEGKKVSIKYLLANFEQYKRFVLLNIYLIFMHMFGTNEKYEVVMVYDEFMENLRCKGVDVNKDSRQKIIKDFEKEATSRCEAIFLSLFKVEKPGEFFIIDEIELKQCKFFIFDFSKLAEVYF